MTILIGRRSLLGTGAFGLAALAAPAGAGFSLRSGFTHDVASGEPRQDSVMLWTRYVPPGGAAAALQYEVAPTEDFAAPVTGGSIEVDAGHDWCVKPVAQGLAPGRWYYYRFIDSRGEASPIGRTRTLPEGAVDRFSIGIFSCSNLPFGWFNAYGHAAARDDLDLVVHLGDYLYEYPRGTYPSADQALAERVIHPAGEILALADYRRRFAAYRADPDLRALHRRFPMVMMWDDHESANDSWHGGAENHQPATEGAWDARKAAATRAYREWMPVSDDVWESYEIGNLATLFRPETRLTARSRPLSLAEALAGRGDLAAALAEFRDTAWSDPARTILGAEQEAWLAAGLRRSTRTGTAWQLLAQQVIMGSISLSPEMAAFVSNDAGEEARRRTAAGLAASRAGLPFNLDMWDGYPAARERLLRSAQEAEASLLVLSGDSHNAWAFDLDQDGAPAGVDLAVHSVTSPGFEAYVGRAAAADVARAVVAHNRQLRWADTSRRGYMTVSLRPDRATAEWLFLETVRSRSTAISGRHRMEILRGRNRLSASAA